MSRICPADSFDDFSKLFESMDHSLLNILLLAVFETYCLQ